MNNHSPQAQCIYIYTYAHAMGRAHAPPPCAGAAGPSVRGAGGASECRPHGGYRGGGMGAAHCMRIGTCEQAQEQPIRNSQQGIANREYIYIYVYIYICIILYIYIYMYIYIYIYCLLPIAYCRLPIAYRRMKKRPLHRTECRMHRPCPPARKWSLLWRNQLHSDSQQKIQQII